MMATLGVGTLGPAPGRQSARVAAIARRLTREALAHDPRCHPAEPPLPQPLFSDSSLIAQAVHEAIATTPNLRCSRCRELISLVGELRRQNAALSKTITELRTPR
jgi:hypothetical protein